jgi:hypothetical protein
MLNKRGAADQVDWALSLSIFLFLVVWFFLIIKPYAQVESKVELIIQKIENEFTNEINFEIKEVPVYVDFEVTQGNAPVIIRKPTNWSNFSVNQGTYYIEDENNLIFLADIKEGNNIIILRTSEKNYSEQISSGIIRESSGNVYVDSKQYVASFSNYMPSQIFFESIEQISNTSYLVNDEELDINSAKKNSTNLYVRNDFSNDIFTMKNYVFLDNSFVFHRLKPRDFLINNYTFKAEYQLDETFIRYNDGSELKTLSSCQYFNNSFLEINNNQQGITFSFNKIVTMSLCPYSRYVKFTFESGLNETLEFALTSHNDTSIHYEGNVLQEKKSRVGLITTTTGLSYSKLEKLQDLSADYLKTSWNLSQEVNFEIQVFNSTKQKIFETRTYTPSVENIFAQQYRNYLMDKYGNQEVVYISVRTW